jgi:hypothetical protein
MILKKHYRLFCVLFIQLLTIMPYSVEEHESNGCPSQEYIFWEEDWKHGIFPETEQEVIENVEEVFYQPIGQSCTGENF